MESRSDRPNRRRARLKFVAALILVCSLPVLFIVWQTRRDNLVLQAERAIDLPDINWHTWLNNNSLFLVDSNHDVYSLDLTTHASTPFLRASTALRTPGTTWPVSLSPARNTLIVLIFGNSGESKFGSIPLDGSASDHYFDASTYESVWLDSETFVMLSGSPPEKLTLDKYTRQGVKLASRKIEAVSGPPLSNTNIFVGVHQGHVTGVSIGSAYTFRTGLNLFNINVEDKPQITSRAIALPEKSAMLSVALSPDGSGLAWLLAAEPHSSSGLMARIFRRFGLANKKAGSVGLWLSNNKGEDFHCLGHLDTIDPEPRVIRQCVQWTPDSNRLSFFYERRLYVFNTLR